MATIINSVQIATYGLGNLASSDVYKVAFPEINFYEIFSDTETIRLIRPGEIAFIEEVGGITLTKIGELENQTTYPQQAQPGGVGNAPRWERKKRGDDHDWKRTSTRVRTFSIASEEFVNSVTIKEIIEVKSISSKVVMGIPTISMGINDDEDILMLLLAA